MTSILMVSAKDFEAKLYALDAELGDNFLGFPSDRAYELLTELRKSEGRLVTLVKHFLGQEFDELTDMEIEFARDLLRHSDRIIDIYFYSKRGKI